MSQQYGGDTATVTTPSNESTTTQSYEQARAAAGRTMATAAIPPDQQRPVTRTAPQPVFQADDMEAELLSYRGFKFGAAFFGWLVAIAMSVLLLTAVGAAAFGTAQVLNYTTSDAKAQPAAAGLTAAGVVAFMLMLAFYAGGYVAGRMARFDGARQGFGVWMIALLIGIVAGGAGWFVNHQYDTFSDIHRPSGVSLSTSTLMMGGIGAAAAVLLLTLITAIIGGKAGQRYHDKIDDLLA